MMNSFFRNARWHTLVPAIPLALAIFWATACTKDPLTKAVNNYHPPVVRVDSLLADAPPIAESVYLQPLGPKITDRAILTAVIDPRSFQGNAFAFDSDEGVVVLHDDGNFPDSIRGDGRFHGLIRINFEELAQIEQAQFAELSALKARTDFVPVRFDGRVARPIERDFLIPRPVINLKTIHSSSALIEWFRRRIALKTVRQNSLVIADPGVINDPNFGFDPCNPGVGNPNNVWSFWHLMEQMAPTPGDPEAFIRTWLAEWSTNQTINGDVVTARPALASNILSGWEDVNHKLDPRKTPFKLVAIVNRLDLRKNSGYSGGNAGEGRLVFNLVRLPGCNVLPMTVIFEYGVNKRGCTSIKAYAKAWYDLKNLTVGSPAYNTQLAAITKQFTERGTNPGKTNQSSLNQLRTNEIAFGSPWQLREFALDRLSHMLEQTTTKNEPRPSLFGSATVDNFVNTNGAANVPVNFPTGIPFLGGQALVPFSIFWNGPPNSAGITNDQARFQFSLNTCSSCHKTESGTQFQHMRLNAARQPEFSRFLTGDNSASPFSTNLGILGGVFKVTDPAGRPAGSPAIRDMADLDRRAADLYDLVNNPCIFQVLTFQPLNMVH